MSAPERIPPGRMTPGPPSGAGAGCAPEPGHAPGTGAAADTLAHGELTVHGVVPDASNGVLYCTAEHGGRRLPCVYKPVTGERPLWDFPDGTLAQREVAAYRVSQATGWGLVPVTVLREGPYGPGMCQLWVGPAPGAAGPSGAAAADTAAPDTAAPGAAGPDGPARERKAPEWPARSGTAPGSGRTAGPSGRTRVLDGPDGPGLLALVDDTEPEPGWRPIGLAEVGGGRTALLVHADDARLRRLAVFDAVINNSDRKGRHLLHTAEGRLYGIDHGVSFHTDSKLRTLLWGWAGEPLPGEALRMLRRLAAALAEGGPLAAGLSPLITPAELDAVRKRTAALLATGRHPLPSGDWPAIPWPPV